MKVEDIVLVTKEVWDDDINWFGEIGIIKNSLGYDEWHVVFPWSNNKHNYNSYDFYTDELRVME